MPLDEEELARIVAQIQQPGEPCYWWIPVNDDGADVVGPARPNESRHASRILHAMLADPDPIVTFHDATPGVEVKTEASVGEITAGDCFCIYQAPSVGIVAHGIFSSSVIAGFHPQNPHPQVCPRFARVRPGPSLHRHVEEPISVRSLRFRLDVFRHCKTDKELYHCMGVTQPVTEADYRLLTTYPSQREFGGTQ